MGKSFKLQQRRVTIKDIAAMANVSIGTVDRVLHKRGEVNQSTHERVMSFVDKLGYTPNLLAKSLALKKSFNIVAMIPDASENNPYWKEPVAGFNRATEELKDYNAKIQVIYFDPGEVKSFVKEFNRILHMNPDGIIMAPNFHEAAVEMMPTCKASDIPLILIDNSLDDGSGLAYFGQDALQSGIVAAKLMNYGLPENATVLIFNLARNKAITRHMQRREQGFKSYFGKANSGHLIKTLSVAVDLSQEREPNATLQKILHEKHNIAGIFVTNSRVHKVASYLSDIGKGDLMLAGYDLIDDNFEYLKKGIIDFLICQKPEDQGYKSAMAMFNFLLTGKQAEKVNLSPIDIIIRENVDFYKNTNTRKIYEKV
jgi:LacI family transcriptional regulator